MSGGSLPGGGSGRAGAGKLLAPKWLFGHLLALGLVLLFVNFGFWQLRRLEGRTAANELMLERLAAAPVGLDSLLPGAAAEPESVAYRRVFADGRFAPEHEILLRSKSRNGQPGWHLLTPLLPESGPALLVDRGWVPRALDTPPVEEAAPPEGPVRVEGRLMPEQDPPSGWVASLAPRDPPEGDLERAYYVDVERLGEQLPFDVAPVYLEMTGYEPLAGEGSASRVGGRAAAEAGEAVGAAAATMGDLPLPPQPPEFSRGSHLSYAAQWFTFALIGVVGYAILLRRTAREPGGP